MHPSRSFAVLATVVTLVLATPAGAQTASRIDFGRDVQPILKDNCVSCHGPSQQLNGFRLDRRSAALRGGTFPVITPGNSAGSRLYLKLIGTQFGQQMPPTGRLSDAQIDVLKRWLDEGAEWPDALAGEGPPRVPDPAATRLMDALRRGDTSTFTRTLSAGTAAAKAAGPAGWTPLMYAALYGDGGSVRDLLAAGADPNAATDSGTTALAVAVHDPEKVRVLLDAGANPNARPDDGRTPLIIAASRRGSAPVIKLLVDKGANVKALSASRTSALRQAAGAGDADVMQLLIAAGADLRGDAPAMLTQSLQLNCAACVELVIGAVDARALGASMIALSRSGDISGVRQMLDKGADINARDGAGRTALMTAAMTDAYPIDVVRLLLERGADVSIRTMDGDTAASLAAVRGGPLLDLLVKAGGTAPASQPASGPRVPVAAHSARAAVVKSLPLLQRADATFLARSGCVSCHNNSLTAHTLALARANRFPVDEAEITAHRNRMPPFLEGWRESVLHGFGIPGNQDTVGYVLYGMIGAAVPADAATDAMAYYLKGVQLADGHWRVGSNRPPIESSEIEVTALAMRSLQTYAPPTQRAEYDRAFRMAATWLASARPVATEDRTFQLLGLVWAKADKARIVALAQELLREQRPDGGWAPIGVSSMASDAYATGEALNALREAGTLTVTSPAYAHGVQYLLDTQLEDGSWHVKTRALPVQAYFESDFPHGRDQFISAAATNWATMALIPVAALERVPASR